MTDETKKIRWEDFESLAKIFELLDYAKTTGEVDFENTMSADISFVINRLGYTFKEKSHLDGYNLILLTYDGDDGAFQMEIDYWRLLVRVNFMPKEKVGVIYAE